MQSRYHPSVMLAVVQWLKGTVSQKDGVTQLSYTLVLCVWMQCNFFFVLQHMTFIDLFFWITHLASLWPCPISSHFVPSSSFILLTCLLLILIAQISQPFIISLYYFALSQEWAKYDPSSKSGLSRDFIQPLVGSSASPGPGMGVQPRPWCMRLVP